MVREKCINNGKNITLIWECKLSTSILSCGSRTRGTLTNWRLYLVINTAQGQLTLIAQPLQTLMGWQLGIVDCNVIFSVCYKIFRYILLLVF